MEKFLQKVKHLKLITVLCLVVMLSSFNKVVAQSNCEGMPNPGNTISSVSSVCPTQNFTLSLENATAGAGVTYQWESADDVDFTVNPENLGTNSTQTANISSSKYFRCLVTCTNSSESAYSTPVLVTATSFLECYCIPPVPSYGCDGDNVVSVVLGTLNDVGQTCTPVYQDRSALQNAIPTLTQGQNIEMSVGVGDGGTEYVGVWIDFDQNGVFDADEFFALGSGNDVIITNNISIPDDALIGETKMRVRSKFGSAFDGTDACGEVNYGSTRDYLVNIAVPPTCLEPTNLQVSDVSATSATLSWDESLSLPVNGYQVFYNITGEFPEESSASMGNIPAGNTTHQTGDILSPNTTYYVWVRSDCGGGDYSYWTGPITFTTLCEPEDIPYYQDFESVSAGQIPLCTEVVQAGSGNMWNTVSNPGYGFTNMCLRYNYSSSNAANSWYFLNGLNLQAGVYYRITFKYGSNSTSYQEKLKLTYGTSASPNDTIETIFDNPNINNNLAAIQVVDFTPATSGVFYIGFNVYSAANQYNLYIDDISIELSPNCIEVSDLVASDITPNSATISWTASSSNPDADYHVYYSNLNVAPADDIELAECEATTTNSIALSDLTDAEIYYVWVRSDCGGGDYSYWTGPITFTTLCAPESTLPYTENFDSYSVGNFPDCWLRPVVYGGYPSIVSAYSVSSPNSLRFQSLTTTPTYAISPAFSEDIHNLRVKFQLKAESTTSSGAIELGVMSDPYDLSTFESVAIIQPENTSFNAYQYDLYSTTLSGENRHIAFKHNSNANNYYFWLDNFEVELSPTCIEPANFVANNLTSNSIDLSWTELPTAPLNGYDIYLSTEATAPTEVSIPTHNTSNDYLIIDTLTEVTTYYVWLRANCDVDDVSVWTGPVTFTTPCEPETVLPYVENFDTYGTGSSAFPACWSRPVTYNSYPYIVSAQSASSPASLRFNSSTTTPTYAVSPAFAEDIQNLRVSFQLKASSATSSGTIDVGVMSDPNDISTFESVATIQPTNTSFNYYYYDLYLATLSGANNYIALRHNATSTSYYYWLDDFKVELSPSCIEVSDLVASDITTNSATISWTASSSDPSDGYQLFYNTTGVAPNESSEAMASVEAGITSISTGDILDDNTQYFVWVRANCGNDDFSEWTGPLSFTTLCAPFTTLPYTENFDTYGTGSDAFPDCWERPVTYNSYPYIVSAYSVSSPNSLRFQSLTTEATYAVSPAFAEDIHNLRVSFQLKAESITSSGNIELGVMSDPFDISTFETVATIQPENTNFNSYVFDLYTTTLSGENMHIAFRHNSNSSIYYYWLDDFVVELSPSCIEPTNFTFGNITSNSAIVQWSPLLVAPDNGYDLYFSLNNTAPTETSMPTYNTDEDSFLIDGLDEETNYYVWLRTNCSDTDQSEWTGPIHIFTGYCTPTNTSTSYWLSSVTTTGGITNISNTNIPSQAGGYGNFSATHSCSNFEGQATTINLAQNSSTGYFYCWIDWNKNMQFDTDELIFGTNSYSSAYQGNINIPAGTEPGEYRMRVANSYLYEITDACTGSGYGQFHDYTFIVIDPPTCYPPIGLTVGTQTVSTATITWDDYNESPENGYEVYYSTTNTTPDDSETDIIEVEVGVQTLTIDELEIETDYYVWVRAICSDDDNSVWAGPVHINIGYCTPAFSSTSDYITNFSLGEINNSTGFSPGGYGNYTDLVANLTSGNNEASLTSSSGSGNHGVAIWIDFNDNLIFEESERVATYDNVQGGQTVSIPVIIPADANPGSHRLRVIYQYNTAGLNINPCASASFGEAEDYTVNIGEPLNNETEIIAYSFAEQIAPATIDNVEHKVNVTVAAGTNLNGLVATFTLSEGATATVTGLPQQSGVTPNNFTYPVVYKVVAENGLDEEFWQVIVDVEDTGLSSEADILSYTIPNQVGLTSINSTNRTVALTVPYGTDVTALVATFTLSNGATAEVETVTQQSGVTPNNFTNPVTYTVTAQNGTTTKDWIVTVTVAGEPLSSEADILTFSFAEQFEEAIINNVNRTVNIKVNEGTNLTNLVATFTLSEGAIAKVAGLVQQSGVTPNNFTNIVIYSVTAEDGTTVKNWAVNVSEHSGIEDIEISKLSIYPNPNNGRFTLDFSDIYGKVNYQIYDTKGSIILSDNLVVNGNAMKEVSLNIAPGVYYVKLITETQSIIEKLVVE